MTFFTKLRLTSKLYGPNAHDIPLACNYLAIDIVIQPTRDLHVGGG